jgi:hypothetical protein
MVKLARNAESHYLALIGDVTGSRAVSDRAGLQRRMQQVIGALNRELSRSMAAPLALTAGDEIQALFREPGAAVQVITRMADELFPVRIRYGLGFGTLSTELGSRVALIDGPAFHRARHALEAATAGDTWVTAEGLGDTTDRAATAMFRLMDVVRSGWTERQAEFVRQSRGRMQKEAAADLQVSRSVVSEGLKAAGFKAVRDGEMAVAALLGQHGGGRT